LATGFCDRNGLEKTFDKVFIPVLMLADDERGAHHISDETQQFIIANIYELVEELGNRFVRPLLTDRLRVLAVCAPGEVHSIGLLMIVELLRHTGATTRLEDQLNSPEELRQVAQRFQPHLLCLSCTMAECVPAALESITMFKREFPKVTIFAGGTAAVSESSKMTNAGCDKVCDGKEETRRAMRQFALKHARSRLRNLR
jgi:methanogenic corrinoid protein MtbC1